MPSPIALQLYSVRDDLAKDFEGVVHRVADMGYIGVEPYGGAFTSTSPQEAAKLFRDLGLQVLGAHSPLPLGDKQTEVLDMMAALGSPRLILPWIPPDEFENIDKIKRNCDLLNEANEVVRRNGMSLLYHNHWQEYAEVEGTYGYRVMLENVDPSIGFEIDTYWVKTAGHDPVAVIKEMGTRAPLLHIKDGPAVKDQPMVALGDGSIDIPAIVAAGDGVTEWEVVELDACATDMLTAIEKSYSYMTSKGLARGKKS